MFKKISINMFNSVYPYLEVKMKTAHMNYIASFMFSIVNIYLVFYCKFLSFATTKYML